RPGGCGGAPPPPRVGPAAAARGPGGAAPRHESADVCDRTHCAWFVGRGPRVLWPAPAQPVLLREPRRDAPPFDEAPWALALAAPRRPGPREWSSHCGGAPLSAHFVWGNGDRRVWPCPRHAGATS